MDYETEIRNLVQTVDRTTPDYREKKRALREKYLSYLQEELEAGRLKQKEFDENKKAFGRAFRSEEAGKKVLSGETTLDPILRMRITNKEGIEYNIESLLNTEIRDIDIGVVVDTVNTPAFKKQIDAYAASLSEEQAANLKGNLTRIKRAITRDKKKVDRKARAKVIDVNIRKYIGATDLSKATTREDIYSFWKEISKKYTAFTSALDNFFKKADTLVSLMPSLGGRRRSSGEYSDRQANIQFAQEFSSELKQIQQKYAEKNLEYLVDFSDVRVPVEKDPKNRLVSALDRILEAEGLNAKKEEIYDSEVEEDDYGSTQRAWEQAYMDAEQTLNIGGERGEVELDEEIEDVLDYDMVTLKNTIEIPTDPLLAYELMKNTKLLALTKESESILRQTLDELKDTETDLDFRTDLGDLIEQLKDTLSIQADAYVLPISVLKNSDFAKFIKAKGSMPSALSKEQISTDVMNVLDDMFEELHVLLTDEKFGFAGGVRATGRGGTLGGALPPRQEARGTSMQSLVYEPKRQVPVNIGTRGKLKGRIKEGLFTPLKELLVAYNEYYIEPLYAGRLPIEIPLFSAGRGAKALSVFLKDVGGETVVGDTYEMLATTEKATLSVQTMRDLANFLIKLESPNIRVDKQLIELAEDASIALTDIFGAEEKNRNYVSAVLMHFMEETNEMDMAQDDFFGRSIAVRARAFERAYAQRKPFPIFALPQFVDSQQSLMTKDAKRKTQYNRLRSVLDKVEDDLPVILTKLLKAHDEIRKALGKPIFYGFMPLKHESYERMIDMLYKKEQIDLSHLEVSNIVKSDNSHSNISKEYGITEEQVYLIKANFR